MKTTYKPGGKSPFAPKEKTPNTALTETKAVGSFLAKAGGKTKSFLGFWGEISFGIPLAILALIGCALLYSFVFQGRPPVDPPNDLWVYGQRFVAMVIASIFTGLAQHFLFGYRSKEAGHSFRDDVYDSCVSAFLLVASLLAILLS